jgi:ribosome biogenesis GTPase / thiamine phosphate phosphatase
LRRFEDPVGAQGKEGHVPFFLRRSDGAILRVNEPQRALVVSTGRNLAWISVDGESELRIAQLRRMRGKRFMPVPGDVAVVRLLEDEQAVIDRIEPRTLTLERRTVDGRAKTMAANVDLLVTVTSLGDPPPRLVTLDQLLAFAELAEIPAAVVFTKPDLDRSGQGIALSALYERLGYKTAIVNPKAAENMDALRALLDGHHAMLSGVSGVGKSTIFRALGGEAVVGDVSRYGLGRQTTTTARLYRLGDGFLIDSPGVNEFGLGAITASELALLFPELGPYAGLCRFTDCTHVHEPGCAVRAAVEQAQIAPSRYTSYRRILQEPP